MTRIQDLGVALKLTLPIILIVVPILIGMTLFEANTLLDEHERQLDTLLDQDIKSAGESEEQLYTGLDNSIRSLGSILVELARDPLIAGDNDQLSRHSQLANEIGNVAYIDFLNPEGESLIFGSSPKPASSSRSPTPIYSGDRLIGFVEIGIDQSQLEAGIATILRSSELIAEQKAIAEVRRGEATQQIVVGALIAAIIVFVVVRLLVGRIVLRPLEEVVSALKTMERKRDYSERVPVASRDELGEMTESVNSALTFLDQQNDQLNDSVIALLEGAARISRDRDLGVKVPVTEDVTGPVADALNQLTTDTARVFGQVQLLATQVAEAANAVRGQGVKVSEVAEGERATIQATAETLAAAASTMVKIAETAQRSNQAAQEATTTTATALETVNTTVEGMRRIRDSIQETGKRIKRLGERSQEISGIVDIINNIAERTHVLALNASMQAAAAGEAGRGFAVVATEVQRLAESSRDATSQIAGLVKNIQIETADTMETMNQATSEVAEQSRLAEQAGEQMQRTRSTTAVLADSVIEIFNSSQVQAQTSNELLERIEAMRAGSEETSQQLVAQTEETGRLVEYSDGLVGAVQLFKVPKAA